MADTPNYAAFEMPQNKWLAAQQAFESSRAKEIENQKTLEAMRSNAQTRQQEQQMFPLKMERAQSDINNVDATIEKIKADTSLTPQHKQLLIGQAQQAAAEARYKNAETDFMPTKYQIEQEKALQTGATKQDMFTKEDQKDFIAQTKEARKQSELLDASKNDLNLFTKHYAEVPGYLKGGYNNPISPAIALATGNLGSYQAAQKDAGRLQLAFLAMQKSGRVTNALLSKAGVSSPNEQMSPEGVAKIVPAMQAMIEQDSQKPAFINAMAKKGVKSGTALADAWSQYKEQYPAIDDEGNIIPENIHKWKEILGEDGATSGAAPGYSSKDAWIKDAQKANPSMSKSEISEIYDQKYGK